jgi:hypothetical protein
MARLVDQVVVLDRQGLETVQAAQATRPARHQAKGTMAAILQGMERPILVAAVVVRLLLVQMVETAIYLVTAVMAQLPQFLVVQ